MDELPPLVVTASALARQVGFALTREEAGPDHDRPSCCLPGVGRILAVLAAGCHGGRIGEIGTGIGVGSAWMTSTMPADCSLVTVEIDEERAAHAARLLAADHRVRVLTGDARELIAGCAPFDLLFADGGQHDRASFGALVDLLRVGGQVVMDDVAPGSGQGGDWPSGGLKREFFFSEPRLVATEIVLPDRCNSLLLGTRRALARAGGGVPPRQASCRPASGDLRMRAPVRAGLDLSFRNFAFLS